MTPVEVIFISVLFFSLVLNGFLYKKVISLLGDLIDSRQELLQMHRERLHPIPPLDSGEVAKQPRAEGDMSSLEDRDNVVFLNTVNEEQR